MTPLPKRRWSTRRQGKKRATIGITLPTLVACTNCKQLTRSHMACAHCNFYKGKKVK